MSGRGRKPKAAEMFERFLEHENTKEQLKIIKAGKQVHETLFADWCDHHNEKLSLPSFMKEYNKFMATIPKEDIQKANNEVSYNSFRLHHTEIFKMIEKNTIHVLRGAYNCMVIYGTRGVGKTHTVMATLEKAIKEGIMDIYKNKIVLEPLHEKGAMGKTRAFVKFLYDNRENRIIVLDDMKIKNEETKDILLAALEDNDERSISYMDEAKVPKKDKIPKKFKFNSRIIFISNKNRLDDALKDRGVVVKVDLNNQEILERIKMFIKEFLPRVPLKKKEKVLNFLFDNIDNIKEVSFRKFKECVLHEGSTENWKDWVLHALNG